MNIYLHIAYSKHRTVAVTSTRLGSPCIQSVVWVIVCCLHTYKNPW